MDRDSAFVIFAILSLIFGVVGLVRGNLRVGVGESDGSDRTLAGGIARLISALLALNSILLFSGSKVGYVILAGLIVITAIVSRR